MSSTLNRTNITLPCKVLFGIPFLCSFCFQFLWTLISLFRLFLVIRSVCGKPASTCSIKSKMTNIIPVISILLSILSACLASYFSEPFLLYRLCRGSCHQFNPDDEWVAVYFTVIPAIILYLPAGVSYAAIFCLVRHARRIQYQESVPTQTVPFIETTNPTSIMESSESLFPTIQLKNGTFRKQHRKSLNETSTSFVAKPDCHQHVKKRLSLPAKLNTHRHVSNAVKTKLAKRNIISAKLSFFVMVFLCLGGGVITFTYNKVPAVQVGPEEEELSPPLTTRSKLLR